MMELRNNVILRSPRSRRLEGCPTRSLLEFVGLRLLDDQLGGLTEHCRADVEEAGGAQLIDPGQRIEAVEPEMGEKARGRCPIERAARAVTPAKRPHPARLHQP